KGRGHYRTIRPRAAHADAVGERLVKGSSDMTAQCKSSPDGKWWWDGSKWQPVEEPPPGPPQAPQPESQKRPRPQTPQSTRILLVIGFGVLGLVAMLGICVAAVAGGS